MLLFNKRMISRYDFDFQSDGKVILTEQGFKKFCEEYEKWMCGKNALAVEKSFRACIKEQVSALKKAIKAHEVYVPYSWRNRNVYNQL